MTTAGIILVAAAFAVWGGAAVWLSVIDFRTKLLPKKIIWPVVWAVLGLYIAAGLAESDPFRILQAVLAGASCAALFSLLYQINPRWLGMNREETPTVLGFGDVRLVGMNGLAVGWFGIAPAWVAIGLGFVLAFPLSVYYIFRYGPAKAMKIESPFGPFLVLGAGVMAVSEALGVTALP